MKLKKMINGLTEMLSKFGDKDIHIILNDDAWDIGSMRLKLETDRNKEIVYDYHKESDEIEIYLVNNE